MLFMVTSFSKTKQKVIGYVPNDYCKILVLVAVFEIMVLKFYATNHQINYTTSLHNHLL